MLETVAAAVEGSKFAIWSAQDPRAYPYANALHLIGLVLLVGSAWIMDARLLGAFRGLWPGPLMRGLVPVAAAGFAMILLSGTVLFAADARALATSDTFRLKLILIALAGINALLFRQMWKDGHEPIPGWARVQAGLSAMLWLAILWQGRMIAYS